jgi:hypothetical protein
MEFSTSRADGVATLHIGGELRAIASSYIGVSKQDLQ